MDDHSVRTLELRIASPASYRPSAPSRAATDAFARPQAPDLTIDPRHVLRVLIGIIAALAFASTTAGTMLYLFRWPEESFGYEMVKLFWLDTEHNIPTLYQCAVMFAASGLFFLLGQKYRRERIAPAAGWYALAAAFTFLAWDEGAQIHETVGIHFGTSYGGSWLYFYAPAAAAFAAMLVPFLLRLPSRTRYLLIASGATFVAGAVVVEFFGQLYADAYGRTRPIYAGLATVEEVLEMLGVALLIYTLLEHLGALPRRRVARR
jgi:hypothetical protein